MPCVSCPVSMLDLVSTLYIVRTHSVASNLQGFASSIYTVPHGQDIGHPFYLSLPSPCTITSLRLVQPTVTPVIPHRYRDESHGQVSGAALWLCGVETAPYHHWLSVPWGSIGHRAHPWPLCVDGGQQSVNLRCLPASQAVSLGGSRMATGRRATHHY